MSHRLEATSFLSGPNAPFIAELYAIEDLCSHADTTLSDGRLIGYQVTCPLHGAQFDVRDGSHQGPPAWEGVPCFPVTEGTGPSTVDLSPSATRSGRNDDVGARFRTR